MPGVVVQTSTSGSVVNEDVDYPYQFIAAGLCERGPANTPVIVEGMGDFELVFGGYASYSPMWNQLNTFFDEGGTRAIVSRVVGPAATTGFLVLKDTTAVTPADTLRVEAIGAGSWSTQLKAQVLAGSVASTVRIVVTVNDVVVEDIDNITSPAEAAYRFSGSAYVKVTDLGSVSLTPLPAVLAATALSAGTDDRAAATDVHYLAALNAVTKDYGDGIVAIPGQTAANIYTGITAHCEATGRIGILTAAKGASDSSLIATAQTINSEFVGLFAPWITVADGLSVKTISPEGYIAACRSRAIQQVGPWRAPAGAIAEARSILGLDQEFTSAVGNKLDAARVNVIRNIGNTTRLYGWRSLSTDEANYAFLSHRDMLNRLVAQAEDQLEQYVFSPIDSKGQLLSRIAAELVGIVQPYRDAGGLYGLTINGREVDNGYKVDVSPTVNTPASLANNEVRAVLKVRIAPVGSLIALDIVKIGSRTPL